MSLYNARAQANGNGIRERSRGQGITIVLPVIVWLGGAEPPPPLCHYWGGGARDPPAPPPPPPPPPLFRRHCLPTHIEVWIAPVSIARAQGSMAHVIRFQKEPLPLVSPRAWCITIFEYHDVEIVRTRRRT